MTKVLQEMYRVGEVAEIVGVAEITVWTWVRSGKIKSVKIGGARRIQKEEVERFIKEGNRKGGE